MQVLIVILIICFLVIIHELGHFIAARRNKVNVEEFGLGIPPKIGSLFTWKGTEFTLNAIPFGGFVRLEGEQGPDEDEVDQIEIKKDEWGPFYAKTGWQRLKIISAGVIINILFAITAFSLAFSFIGIPQSLEDQPRIGFIIEDSPAAQVSLPVDVNIVEIRADSRSFQIDDYNDVIDAVEEVRGQEVTIVTTKTCEEFTCPDETQEFNLYVRTEEETPEDQGAIGIAFQDTVFVHYPWYEMPFRGSWVGIKQSLVLAYLILQALGGMVVRLVVSGEVPRDVAGLAGIVYETQQGNIITDNFWNNLGFAAMLSLNLGIINILPIPALDGGRAFFIFLEKIFKKEKVQKIEAYANYVGFALIVILMILITINDFDRIFSSRG